MKHLNSSESRDEKTRALKCQITSSLNRGSFLRLVFTSDGVRVRVGVIIRNVASAYDLVKTRSSESEAEAKELNQSQSAGMCIVIVYPGTYACNSDNLVFTRS